MKPWLSRREKPSKSAGFGVLGWSHYRSLMKVENKKFRNFYLEEAIKSNWSTRQLERQINSFFYEMLLSSQNKEKETEEIKMLEPAKLPEDIIRDPYILEFLGLNSNDNFYESDLKQALITHLQKFLLELDSGFVCCQTEENKI